MAITIGVDHGNMHIKTSSGLVFPSGYKRHDAKPIGNDALEWEGSYYTLTSSHLPFTWDKTQNDDFFVLTLFAIAMHCEKEEIYYPNDIVDVNLGVGLPPADYGKMYTRFEAYFKRPRNGDETLSFRYHGKQYYVYVENVMAFPQGYAAAATFTGKLQGKKRIAIIDIGGMTVDYMILQDGTPDPSSYGSLEHGIILLYNTLKEGIRGDYGRLVDEGHIDEMLSGVNVLNKPEIMAYVKQSAGEFTQDMLAQFRERQIDLSVIPAVFVGGGVVTLHPYIRPLETVGQSFSVIQNVCANAAGYEKMLRHALLQKGR